MEVKHDSDGHDEKHARKLMRLRRRLQIISLRKVIRVEHGSRDDLIPVR